MNKNIINQSQYKSGKYESYISKYFEALGYKIIEYTKVQGVKDCGIDLMLKKGREFVFVKCKDWDSRTQNKIDSKDIQYTRMNVRDYIENKKALFDMYNWKIFYVTSTELLDKSAKHKIEEFSHEIEHKVIMLEIKL